ncbi:methyltransferase family protein [Peptoniphilus asaccharolyticus]
MFKYKIVKGIRENRLVTEGIYAYVRNPIYSAWLFICNGVLFLGRDIWLIGLSFIFYFYLTILVKFTEEKWLLELYGKEYEPYCKQVNRVIPWF